MRGWDLGMILLYCHTQAFTITYTIWRSSCVCEGLGIIEGNFVTKPCWMSTSLYYPLQVSQNTDTSDYAHSWLYYKDLFAVLILPYTLQPFTITYTELGMWRPGYYDLTIPNMSSSRSAPVFLFQTTCTDRDLRLYTHASIKHVYIQSCRCMDRRVVKALSASSLFQLFPFSTLTVMLHVWDLLHWASIVVHWTHHLTAGSHMLSGS